MNITNTKILVIGGAGFIGSHIVDQLLQEPVREIVVLDNLVRGKRANLERALTDRRVTLVNGSVMDLPLLHQLMSDVDGVFHLAALWLFECVHKPREALEINVNGTFNVIEAARDAHVKRVVYSSSASVYGNAVTLPMPEEHPFNNRTMYGATKIAGEQFFRAFYEQHRLPYVGLRYMNVYGPRMDDKGAYVSVVMKVLEKLAAGQPPEIHGDGEQAYDFVHVDDIARMNILALKSDLCDDFFNVGAGVKTTINELVQMLLQVSGSHLKPVYIPQEHIFVTNRVGSTEKAERLLGFRARVPISEGLRTVFDWWTKTSGKKIG